MSCAKPTTYARFENHAFPHENHQATERNVQPTYFKIGCAEVKEMCDLSICVYNASAEILQHGF